jgi:branched-chain amino acid transport system substrate-binding protein
VRSRVRKLGWVPPMALAVAAFALGGCGDDNDKGGGGGASAKGDIVITDLSDGYTAEKSRDSFSLGEKAAVEYVNNDLGGIGGRHLRVIRCDGKTDPATVTACANKLIANRPVATIGASDLFGTNAARYFQRAGVPAFIVPLSEQDATNAEAFPVAGNTLTEYPGMGYYWATAMKAKKAALLLPDAAVGRDIAKQIELGVRGTGLRIATTTYFPVTGADVTPAIAKSVSGDPDVLFVAISGDAAGVQMYSQIAKQGFPMNRVVASSGALVVDGFLGKLGKIANGAYFSESFASFEETGDPQVKAFRESMRKYAGVSGGDAWAQWGFSTVMAIYNAIKAVGDDVSADAIMRHMKAAQTFPGFMTHDRSAKSAPPKYPALQNPYVRVVQWKDGKVMPASDPFVVPQLMQR